MKCRVEMTGAGTEDIACPRYRARLPVAVVRHSVRIVFVRSALFSKTLLDLSSFCLVHEARVRWERCEWDALISTCLLTALLFDLGVWWHGRDCLYVCLSLLSMLPRRRGTILLFQSSLARLTMAEFGIHVWRCCVWTLYTAVERNNLPM